MYKVGASHIDEQEQLGVIRMRSELWLWYADQRRREPDRDISMVHDLTVGMFGARGSPSMHHLGGAQIKSLVGFFVSLLEKYTHSVPQPQGAYLVKAGRAALQIQNITYMHGRRMPQAATQQMFDNLIVFNKSMQSAEGPVRQKNHKCLHLLAKTEFLGNIRFRNTYRCESLNGTVAILAQSVHRSTFVRSVLSRYQLLRKYSISWVSGTCQRRDREYD